MVESSSVSVSSARSGLYIDWCALTPIVGPAESLLRLLLGGSICSPLVEFPPIRRDRLALICSISSRRINSVVVVLLYRSIRADPSLVLLEVGLWVVKGLLASVRSGLLLKGSRLLLVVHAIVERTITLRLERNGNRLVQSLIVRLSKASIMLLARISRIRLSSGYKLAHHFCTRVESLRSVLNTGLLSVLLVHRDLIL